MPRKPKRPCSWPGCPNLTEGRFCEEHQKEENRRYEKYGRDPAVRRRYGRAWKRIRDKYASEHPLCEQCLKEGRYVKTEEIHHKLPLSQGGTHERSNLIALCRSCHGPAMRRSMRRMETAGITGEISAGEGRSKSQQPFFRGTVRGCHAQK